MLLYKSIAKARSNRAYLKAKMEKAIDYSKVKSRVFTKRG